MAFAKPLGLHPKTLFLSCFADCVGKKREKIYFFGEPAAPATPTNGDLANTIISSMPKLTHYYGRAKIVAPLNKQEQCLAIFKTPRCVFSCRRRKHSTSNNV